MPIPPELTQPNEADFTVNFLMPLLRKIGFGVVVHYHGASEFGKDIVFGEIDRFGMPLFHALQAKYVPTINQHDAHALVDDCKEAFTHPFKHPGTGQEHRISTFTVANAGTITDNARAHFFATLAVPYGGSVRLIDGTMLLQLDRLTSLARSENVRDILAGLTVEFAVNDTLAEGLLDSVDKILASAPIGVDCAPLARLCDAAVTSFIARPIPQLVPHIATLTKYRICVQHCNRLLDTAASIRATPGVDTSTPRKRHFEQCKVQLSQLVALSPICAELLDKLKQSELPLTGI